ncbi:MAG TPA: hypothetical protein VNA25_14355 [Phycisphaerae bacterium]|nr:hypothetical protein [Phycisphaerae bacterium]
MAVPLRRVHIGAANRCHKQLGQWQAIDRALDALAERFPEFDGDSVLLKATAINALYGTNVMAIWRMADHVRKVIAETDLPSAGPQLVERLAALPKAPRQKKDRRHLSFASKFTHFFVDRDRFPMMDKYTAKMVRFHLGRRQIIRDPARPYSAFCENLKRLRSLAGLTCFTRELDHYLWLAGLYREWLGGNTKVNVEVKDLFEATSGQTAADLRVMLG